MVEINASKSSTATSQKHSTPLKAVTGSLAAPGIRKNRQRRPGDITQIACTECRKKRARCSGQQPCTRCKQQKVVDCIYEASVRQSKECLRGKIEVLRDDIEQLRRQEGAYERVISALVQPRFWEKVSMKLRGGDSIEIVSNWLKDMPLDEHGLSPHNELPEHRTVDNTTQQPGGTGSPSLTRASLGSKGTPSTSTPHQHQDQDGRLDHNLDSLRRSRRSHFRAHIMPSQLGTPSRPVFLHGIEEQSSSSFALGSRAAIQALNPLGQASVKIPANYWTNVPVDTELVDHLLALYFCWEYPTFASLSKEHFLKDFRDGRHRYCSPTLVNALLALGCRFSTQINSRAKPDDLYTSGDQFFQESLSLLSQEDHRPSVTTVQSFSILSIREASCGRASESWYYAGQGVRLALEMGLHQPPGDIDKDELAVQSTTFWGAFALDQLWSLMNGSLPHYPPLTHLPSKPAIIDADEVSLWSPYTGDGTLKLSELLLPSREQPSAVQSVFTCFCELSELIHHSLYILYSPIKPVTSHSVADIYIQYLAWYDGIPEGLQFGHNYTPAVLFLYMYYHFAMLLLFTPLMRLRIINSEIVPRDICRQAADALRDIIRSYSELYSLRRTPTFIPYFAVNSTIIHFALSLYNKPSGYSTAISDASNVNLPKSAPAYTHQRAPSNDAQASTSMSKSINESIANLLEMKHCHHSAAQAFQTLRYLANKWQLNVNITWPKIVFDESVNKSPQPINGTLDSVATDVAGNNSSCVCGAEMYTKEPSPEVHAVRGQNPTFIENGDLTAFADDIGENLQKYAEESGTATETMLKADGARSGVENPLFWPFPIQRRPMLLSGPLLAKAGFTLA